jgi:cell division protein FtsL
VSPRAAATAVARGAAATIHAPSRSRAIPRRAPQRRRSGASPRSRAAQRGRVIALPRVEFVPLLDRILRGPLYIAVVGVLLAGIVFFNVDVLELNHGIARTDVQAAQLKRENAALTLKLAQLGSSERIQNMALNQGLVLPPPGDVRYLRAGRDDAAHALRVMTAPDPTGAVAVTPTVVSQQSTPQPGISATTSAPVTPTTSAAPTAASTASAPTTTATPQPTTTVTPATSAPATAAQTTP